VLGLVLFVGYILVSFVISIIEISKIHRFQSVFKKAILQVFIPISGGQETVRRIEKANILILCRVLYGSVPKIMLA